MEFILYPLRDFSREAYGPNRLHGSMLCREGPKPQSINASRQGIHRVAPVVSSKL
jgi:hypothetical protein